MNKYLDEANRILTDKQTGRYGPDGKLITAVQSDLVLRLRGVGHVLASYKQDGCVNVVQEAISSLESIAIDLAKEKDYSKHYEGLYHKVAAECAELAERHIGTVGDIEGLY